MERFCIVGTSWRTGGMEQIARLTLPAADRDERLSVFAQDFGLQELLYLATCNRVELAFVLGPGACMDTLLPQLLEGLSALCAPNLEQPVRSQPDNSMRLPELSLDCWQGEEAVRHLFVVAAGLDSAQPGEHEVRGQLRRALSDGSEAGHAGPIITDLVNASLLAARRIHRKALGDQHCPASLARIALDLVKERCNELTAVAEQAGPGAKASQKAPEGPLRQPAGPIALFGVSPITIQCAHRLARSGHSLLVVNRSPKRAQELIRELGGTKEFRACDQATEIEATALSFEEFRSRPPAVVAAISATAATDPILDRTTLKGLAAKSAEQFAGALRFIDMAVPGDIRADDAEAAGIERFGMSAMNERAQAESAERQATLDRAAAALTEEIAAFYKRRSARTLGGVFRGLGDRTRATLRTGLDEVVACRLQELENAHCGLLDDWAQRMADRVSHVPFVGLRAIAAQHGPEVVKTFLAASDPELADSYRDALASPEEPADPADDPGRPASTPLDN